jgi:HNH endonuclease
MDFVQITNRSDIQAAFNTVKSILEDNAATYSRTVGFQGESLKKRLHWHKKYHFWSIVDPNMVGNRFWIAFGTQDPVKRARRSSFSITCETNVPKRGVDRRISGSLYRKGNHTYLCHNGRVGGGARGVGKTAFLAWYEGRGGVVEPHGIVVGELSGSPTRFLSETARFVRSVEQFKREVKATQTIDQELKTDAGVATDEGEFDARGFKGDRERTLRSINIRRGQPDFRNKLLKAYSSRCAISGYDCADALEAAHICGYWTEESNHVQNGLLLRSDLHTLFDIGKIGIDPQSFRVIVSDQLKNSKYAIFRGKKLRTPASGALRPSAEALLDHLKRWKLQ